MKVLNLFCSAEHGFEGWFGSEEDFQRQQHQGLVQCPLCGDHQVRKGLSAPRLNLGAVAPTAVRAPTPAAAAPVGSEGAAHPVMPPQLQAAWLQLARRVLAQTEDVGTRFASEARRMHHGEAEERAIRGQASAEEARELLDEGIAVLPLLLPEAAKETLQ